MIGWAAPLVLGCAERAPVEPPAAASEAQPAPTEPAPAPDPAARPAPSPAPRARGPSSAPEPGPAPVEPASVPEPGPAPVEPASGPAPPTPSRRAVIVGVGRYPDPLLTDLRGPARDAAEVYALLTTQFGFAASQSALLVDADATRAAIEAALDQMVEASQPGDVAVFYFSGHGSRVFDVSGDEPDGWDEALVPVDSGRGERPNRDLIDDRLHPRLAGLAANGVAVTFIYDACHSGDGSKGLDSTRSAPPDTRPGGGARPQQARGLGPAPDDRPRHALLAAAAQDELAYEKPLGPGGVVRGLFTWHLVRALRAAPPQATWRSVMADVRRRVRAREPRQTPQAEGHGLDRVLFGLEERRPRPFVEVRAVEGRRVTLGAGEAHGLSIGARYDVHAATVLDPASTAPIGRATVIEVEPLRSVARLDAAAAIAVGARAFERASGPSAVGVPVYLPPEASGVAAALAARPPVRIVSDPGAARLRLLRDGSRWTLQGDDAAVLEGFDAGGRRRAGGRDVDAIDGIVDDIAYAIADAIERRARWAAIDAVTHHDPQLDIELRIEAGGAGSAGTTRLRPGQRFSLVVANRSSVDLYLSILALGGDGSVAVVYPQPGVGAYVQAFGEWRQAADAALPPGERRTRDRLRLIATTRPTDFRFLEQGGAPGARARAVHDPSDPVVALFAAAGLGAASRGEAIPRGRWTTRTVDVEVVGP